VTADPFELSGHVAVLTGGGSGIGLGMAEGLARAGASVAILGRNADRLASAASSLREHGGAVLPLPCDVSDEDACSSAMEHVVAELGRIDSCFANAAVDGPFAGLLDTSLADFRAVTAVNLDAVFLTFREAARHMIARGDGGSLVATSSVGARMAMPRQLPYAAAKGGLISLTTALSVDLARHGIRVNAVLPGFIDTELTHEMFQVEAVQQRVLPRVPSRRWGAPDDFAGLAVYLASPASSYHTGDAITVDGGFSVF
jgi:NAD(P)-dependent dehydrogenase (short-subunit alcohol dehydrogenase family)